MLLCRAHTSSEGAVPRANVFIQAVNSRRNRERNCVCMCVVRAKLRSNEDYYDKGLKSIAAMRPATSTANTGALSRDDALVSLL